MIFSIHVPKTAGTAFRSGLPKGSRFLYSNKWEEPCLIGPGYGFGDLATKRSDQTVASIVTEARDSGAEILHGHYKLWEVNSQIARDDRVIAWVRNPVTRAISEWAHFAAMRGLTGDVNPLDEDCRPFFASIANKMSDYLEPVHMLDWVGITERYQESLDSLKETLDLHVLYSVTNKSKLHVRILPELTALVMEYNRKDRILYEKAIAGKIGRGTLQPTKTNSLGLVPGNETWD